MPSPPEVASGGLHIVDTIALPSADAVLEALPGSDAVGRHVARSRAAIRAIIDGRDRRRLVVVGPCSIHDPGAALAYAAWLAERQTAHADALCVVMRLYFQKPRTQLGWQGLVDDPYLDDSGRVGAGLTLARELLLDVNALGLPAATEFVDAIAPLYLADLVSWSAIGARTAESPAHRQLASALPCPVGFKNATSGDVRPAINGLLAARRPQRLVGATGDGRVAVLTTRGNTDGHLVLRGGTGGANFDGASVDAAVADLRDSGLPPRVMVDCGHGNCGGDYRRQAEVALDVARRVAQGDTALLGVMLESALVEGRQPLTTAAALTYGQSITDACLGLADTDRVLAALADAVRHRG